MQAKNAYEAAGRQAGRQAGNARLFGTSCCKVNFICKSAAKGVGEQGLCEGGRQLEWPVTTTTTTRAFISIQSECEHRGCKRDSSAVA